MMTNVQIGTLLGSFLDEDFSGGVPPSGWTTTHPSNWGSSSTSNAGGTSPEARFSWTPSATSTFRLYTGAMDTTGLTNIDLSFKHYVNDYNGAYNLGVETSTDGVTWNTVWYVPGGPMGPETITIPLTTADGLGSSTFYVSWTFFGYSYNINYWYVDDVLMEDVSVITEYDEDICTLVLDPGEEAQLIFPDWTPAGLALGISGTLKYGAIAEQELPGDTNPANDIMGSTFELDYWHDIGIKEVTSPAIGGKLVDFLGYDDGYTENSWAYTAGEDWQAAIQLTDAQLAPHRTDEITQVMFSCGSDDYGFYVADYEIWISDQLEDPTAPPVVYGTGTSSGTGWDTVPLDMPYDIPDTGDVYLGITYSNYGAGVAWPAGVDESNSVPEGFWFYYSGVWQDATGLLGPSVWGLDAGVTEGGGGPGAPTPEIWMPIGSDSIDTILENLGTFEETGLTCYAEILEFITNETSGTLVWDANVTGIDLDPLGGEETLAFGSYGFPIQGVYGLYLDLPLGNDDFPNNNGDVLGIGVDDTAPNSQHTIDPATPDGENGWYVSDVTVSFTADDGTEAWQSGVDHIEYKVNGGSVQTGNSVTLTTDGDHDVEYRAVDNVGNAEGWNSVTTIQIDQTVPNVELTWESPDNVNVVFTATCSDATSGMDYVEFYLNDGLMFTAPAVPFEYTIAWSPTLKTAEFTAKAFDMAGHFATDMVTGIEAIPVPQGQTTPTPVTQKTNSL